MIRILLGVFLIAVPFIGTFGGTNETPSAGLAANIIAWAIFLIPGGLLVRSGVRARRRRDTQSRPAEPSANARPDAAAMASGAEGPPWTFEQIGEMTKRCNLSGLLTAFSLGDWPTRELVAVAFSVIKRDFREGTDYRRAEMIAAVKAMRSLCVADASGGSYRENCLSQTTSLLQQWDAAEVERTPDAGTLASSRSTTADDGLPSYSAVLTHFPEVKPRGEPREPLIPPRYVNAAGLAFVAFLLVGVLHGLVGLVGLWGAVAAGATWLYFRGKPAAVDAAGATKAERAKQLAIICVALWIPSQFLSLLPMGAALAFGALAAVGAAWYAYARGDDWLRRSPSRPPEELPRTVTSAVHLAAAIGLLTTLDERLRAFDKGMFSNSEAASQAPRIVSSLLLLVEDAQDTLVTGQDEEGQRVPLESLAQRLMEIWRYARMDLPFVTEYGGPEAVIEYGDMLGDLAEASRAMGGGGLFGFKA